MGYRLPVEMAVTPMDFLNENIDALKVELATVAVEAYSGGLVDNYKLQRLGEVIGALEGVKRGFQLNGWKK